jgi:preprotein translocase subunit SecG
MDLALLVYGISVMSKLSALLAGLMVICVIAFGVGILMRGFHVKETWHTKSDNEIYEPRRELAERIMKWSAGIIVGSSIILAFIPSERTSYTMVPHKRSPRTKTFNECLERF